MVLLLQFVIQNLGNISCKGNDTDLSDRTV